MRRSWTLLACLLLLALPGRTSAKDPAPQAYPPTAHGDAKDVLHGVEIPDPYRWMEDDDAEDVVAWDQAQDAFARSRLDPIPGRAALGEAIAKEFDLGGIHSVPTFFGGRRWTTWLPPGKNSPVLYAADESGGEPHPVLDPNEWSADGTVGLQGWWPSPDGKFLVYAKDEKGSENSTLFVHDLATGKDLADRIPRAKFSSVAWSPDASGFYYDRNPEPGSIPEGEEEYHRRIRWHRVGTAAPDEADAVVFGAGRPMLEGYGAYLASDEEHLLIAGGMPYKAIDTYEIVEKDGIREVRPVLVGADTRTYVDRAGDLFVLDTDHQAPRRRVCVAKADEVGDPAKWKEILPQTQGVIAEGGVHVVGDKVVVLVRDDLVSRLRVIGLDGKDLGEIGLPSPGTVEDVAKKKGDSRVWFSFESTSTPSTTFECDLSKEGFPLKAVETLPTTIDVSGLVSVRETFPSKDGTKIPVFLLYRKDSPPDGRAPVVLYGYGGFRVGMYPYFSRTRGLWAERGGVWAVACLRGGDEYGEEWHEAGSLANKQNVYDDFQAVADGLVSTKRASRERLAIWGGSNGGLLVAACVNQRPDLCRAAVCQVPLTDMIRFHRFQYAKEWTMEYGDPDEPKAFEWIRRWSPVHNVKEGVAYPAVLVTSGVHDGRVNSFHARKIAARWQEATSASPAERPILLRIDRSSGHGAASNLQRKAEVLDELSFVAQQLGGLPKAGAER